MLIKVPYINKNDNLFYDIIKTESNLDSFFCYEVKNDLVYVNQKNQFYIKMPKLIKKLQETSSEEFFIILELVLDTIYIYVNNGEKDFEYYEYSNSEKPLTQLFLSVLGGEVQYKIYYIENYDLKKTIDSVLVSIANFTTTNNNNVIPVNINISQQDIDLFFTKISIQDKIKTEFNNVKNKFLKIIEEFKKNQNNKKIKQTKKESTIVKEHKENKNRLILIPLSFIFVGYALYSNGILKNLIDKLNGQEEMVVVETNENFVPQKPQIDYKKIYIKNNYSTFKFIENKLKNNIDFLEISNKAIYISKEEVQTNNAINKYIDKNLYMVEEDVTQIDMNNENNIEFDNFDNNLNLNNYIDYKSKNQIILKVDNNSINKVIHKILYNDKLKYNINIYNNKNEEFIVIVYSDNIIEEFSKVKVINRNDVTYDSGSFNQPLNK